MYIPFGYRDSRLQVEAVGRLNPERVRFTWFKIEFGIAAKFTGSEV